MKTIKTITTVVSLAIYGTIMVSNIVDAIRLYKIINPKKSTSKTYDEGERIVGNWVISEE